MLQKVYGDQCLFRRRVLSGLKVYSRYKKEVEDDLGPGCHRISKRMTALRKSAKSSEKIGAWISALLPSYSISTKRLLDKFFTRIFNVRKMRSKMVPSLLTREQKEIQMTICVDILQNTENDPNFLKRVSTLKKHVITSDESYFYLHSIQKPNANHCIGRVPVYQNRKSCDRPNSSSRQWCLCFSISRALFMWFWCLKDRQLTKATTTRVSSKLLKNGLEEKGLKCWGTSTESLVSPVVPGSP